MEKLYEKYLDERRAPHFGHKISPEEIQEIQEKLLNDAWDAVEKIRDEFKFSNKSVVKKADKIHKIINSMGEDLKISKK